MAIDLDDLKTIYQEFLDGSKTALLEVQKQTQMEDEHFATAVAQIISNTMTSSIQALDVIHGITIKSEQSAKDLLVKDAQIASENASKDLKMQQKTSMIAEDTIKSAQSAKDLLVKDAQKILLTNQAASEVNKGALLVRQTSALDDARNVKKAEILGETIGMIQSAGITPPSNMQTDFTSALKAIV